MTKAVKTTLLVAGSSLCVAIVLVMSTDILCASFDPATARINDAAKQWLHFWPGQFDWNARLEYSRWKPVVPTKLPAAEAALATTPSVALTEAQALDFTGEGRPPEAVTARPYLIRSVVAGRVKKLDKFMVDLNARSRNTDIWVASGAIGRCPVPMRRQPLVVWLDNPPREVFVTFGVAE